MEKIIGKLFSKHRAKKFFAWQIELTTRCPLRCKMCIRGGLKDWHSGDMAIENFKRLVPYFKDVQTIILQGWGEPLLYKNLIDAIKIAKEQCAEIGFITSGMGLNKDYISDLINSGLDFICFSLAGAQAGTHDAIRISSDFQALLNNMKMFDEIKTKNKTKKPDLRIVYLMLKDNINEIINLPQTARETGVDEIALINLIHITNEWQERQKVFKCIGESEYGTILKEAEIKAKKLKIRFRMPSLSPVEIPVCEENPLRNLYVSVDGEVSPCVFLYPPTASSNFKRIYCSEEYEINKLSFGNIFKASFYDIWNNRHYIDFREHFLKRKKTSDDIRPYLFDQERLRRFEFRPLTEPPEYCRICHKMLGV